MPKFSREHFLYLATVGTAGLVLRGCNEKPPVTGSAKEVEVVRQRLLKTIEELPGSTIKDLLVNEIVPFYKGTVPPSINLGGEDIRVLGSSLTVTRPLDRTSYFPSGAFALRNESEQTKAFPLKNETLIFPYVGLLKDDELKGKWAGSIAVDKKTPIVKINFPTNAPVYSGVNPLLVFTLPSVGDIPKGQEREYEFQEKCIFVKEAALHLVSIVWLDRVINDMQRLGLPVRFPVQDMSGNVTDAEFATHAFGVIFNRQSRLQAAIDISGYLIAYKAFEGTDVAKYLTQELPDRLIFQQAASQQLGETKDSIVANALKWAVNSSLAQSLFHNGQIENTP